MRYDYAELRQFLLPDHKWLYFSIRAIRTNGWIYFLLGMFPILGNFCTSEQPKTAWNIAGAVFFALGGAFISLKAYRSQSPNGEEPIIKQDKITE